MHPAQRIRSIKEGRSLLAGSRAKKTTSTLTLLIKENFEKLPATIHSNYDWAKDEAGIVWASIRYDHPALLPKINPQTVLKFVPIGGRVWFVLNTDTTRNHVEMLHYLGSKGIRFGASATYAKKDPRVLQAGTIIANTNDSEIIRAIFNIYFMDWVSHWPLFFVVSERDLGDSEAELSKIPSLMSRRLLDNVNCVLATYYDHGMELLTSRLSTENIESTAKNIASEFNLSFRIEKEAVTRS